MASHRRSVVTPFDELHDLPQSSSNEIDILKLNEAFDKLATFDSDQARLVELWYVTGLSIDETPEALGFSAATVKGEWVITKAWLRRELSPA